MIDKTDTAILTLIQQDSTIPTKDIAAQVGLSVTPTYERIRRMEQQGIIKKYVALLDREKLGLGIVIYCNIVLKDQSKQAWIEFEKAVTSVPEILEVVSLSGTYDFMLKIVSADVTSYNNFVMDVISELPHIAQYHSNIVLTEAKRETALPLPK